SASFANPAITIGRMFTDSFAGIAPASAPAYIGAQLVGGALAVVVIRALYPRLTPAQAASIVVPHETARAAGPGGRDGASSARAAAPGQSR
ncbi:MAG: aquaporin, partial [Streptosporangiaceae bacterium]